MLNSPPKILVVGPSWVGDMVMAQSLFITLNASHPDCQIDVLAPAWSFALLARMPEVANAIAMPLAHGQFGLWDRIRLGKTLRINGYDQAIVLPNSWKSALIPYFANIPIRTGYIGECRWGLLNDARKLDKKLLTMTVQRFVALGLPNSGQRPPECPVPSLSITVDQQQAVIEKFGLMSTEKILALCPGAEYGPAKRWPARYYAELAKHKLAEGWQVCLFGSEKDQEVAAEINREVPGCVDFTGRTSMAEAVDLLSLANTVVTNDSGLMHVAAALDKNIIALYGSSDPNFTPPLNGKSQVLSLQLDCSPCFKRECPFGHTQCLEGLMPAQVIQAMQDRY
ncbi:MAG: lipopolysaccharide heptosyltransferase II [Methylococcales bacterium]|nr:lipopolysaccharide heptosyltransferase II [Methylococcales bacterium]